MHARGLAKVTLNTVLSEPALFAKTYRSSPTVRSFTLFTVHIVIDNFTILSIKLGKIYYIHMNKYNIIYVSNIKKKLKVLKIS